MASVYQTISDELYLGQPGPDAILPADLLGCWKRCSTLSGFHSQPSAICQDMARGAINLFVFVCECVRLTLGSVSNSSRFPLSLVLSFPKPNPTKYMLDNKYKQPSPFAQITSQIGPLFIQKYIDGLWVIQHSDWFIYPEGLVNPK